MIKFITFTLTLIILGICLLWSTSDKDIRRVILSPPTDRDALFWSQSTRNAMFRAMDRFPVLAESRVIAKGDSIHPMPDGVPLNLDIDINDYMKEQHSSSLIIVHNGKIRLEKYGNEFGPEGKWTSFSVGKSFTSTLLGAAIKDGFIRSVDDKVSDYVPDLMGSAYEEITIKQILTMTSGIRWNENYADPQSDVALFNFHEPDPGVDASVSYMRRLQPEAEPGTKWVYKTGETNLIGVVVSSATNKSLAEYLSEKIWQPFGMEQEASWILGSTNHEISGCCIQASTRDFARFGLFMLGGGIAKGQSVLPENWITEATSKQADIGQPGEGYGYQWWTMDNGAYAAKGIFGQGIFIDPKRQLVIASNSNWPQATDDQGGDLDKKRLAFFREVQLAIDNELDTD